MIRKLKHIIPDKETSFLSCAYTASTTTANAFCITAWSSTFAVHLHPLRLLQNKVVRVLMSVDKPSSLRFCHVELDIEILPISGLVKFHNAPFMLVPK